ncbi:MAG: amino acid permease [Vampirovibrionales bacterium]|nr:amino acid permease [Vampirovibrionales bacterium]
MSPLLNQLFRTKSVELAMAEASGEANHGLGTLKKCLSGFDLMMLGVGAIIGAGVFVLTGVAAHDKAGPGIMLSYLFAGTACVFAALCYAEFAARIPIAGSAYAYAYTSLGEIMAWIIGWDLTLEYTVGAAAVARGWAGYLEKVLHGFGLNAPVWFTHLSVNGLLFNPMAALIVLLVTTMLCIGVKESARFNALMVMTKLFVVLFVIFMGLQFINPINYEPFLPFGAGGIVAGAAYIFFAYIGFDAVSTAAEEVKNPQRDLPIGIIGSLVICTILYIAVSAVITGMVPFNQIDVTAPLAAAFGQRGLTWAQTVISLGAFAGLTTVVLVMLMSQPRIFMSMARDGLFFKWMGKISEKFGTPVNASIVCGLICAIMTFAIDIEHLAEMVNIGTLFAFTIVCGSVMVLRYRTPDKPHALMGLVIALMIAMGLAIEGWYHHWSMIVTIPATIASLIMIVQLCRKPVMSLPQTFKCPWVPAIPILGMGANLFMMANLSVETWTRLWVWLALGLVIYFGYSMKNSRLNKLALPSVNASLPTPELV